MKIQKENLIIEKNRELLTKDINLIKSIDDIFLEIISSYKIKSLIFKNKKSKQFNKASLSKESEANVSDNDKKQEKEKHENKTSQESMFITIDKKTEVVNVTCFNQSNLKSIDKFFSIYTEKDYIKDEFIKLVTKVK
jgi:hypothetical protein